MSLYLFIRSVVVVILSLLLFECMFLVATVIYLFCQEKGLRKHETSNCITIIVLCLPVYYGDRLCKESGKLFDVPSSKRAAVYSIASARRWK